MIEKLEFGLVYGTDIEKVRKILKKVGEGMMKDPEIAAVLLEPFTEEAAVAQTAAALARLLPA